MIQLIHIGKCGGSTVSTVLSNNKIKYKLYHVESVTCNPTLKYVIVIRNPIERFISAFNWRYKLVVLDKTQEHRFKGEKEILEKYKTANNLAEHIFELDTYIHHIKEDIHFYLGEFLKKCKKEHIQGVITTPYMNKDIEQVFGITNRFHEKKNKIPSMLSEQAYENITRYLHRDYECIDRLHELGCLSEQQYNYLKKTKL